MQASKKHVSTPAESSSSHKEGNTFAPGKIGVCTYACTGLQLMCDGCRQDPDNA